MELVDIGVNFHSGQLRDHVDELLERAHAAGVTRVMATGTTVDASERAALLAAADARVWATAGVHPHHAQHFDAAAEAQLAPLWRQPRVVAVGECGLDYNRMFSPKEAQRAAFARHIDIAIELGKPLFLHCRDAFEDFHAMLREAAQSGASGCVHCFTGDAAEAEAYLALGFDLGVTGWVSDEARGGALRAALHVIPLDRLHLETDAPYLRPRNAGKTRPYNEPALLPFVARSVAQIRGVAPEAVAAAATRNSVRVFELGDS